MMPEQILRSFIDPVTGFPVEEWERKIPSVGAGPTFWFAYPDDTRNAFKGSPGDTPEDAIRNLQERIAG